MINGKIVLAIISARGGSKGVLRKNIREIGGKPLIAWTIEAGLKSKYIDRLILTSEDNEIMEVAKQWGCEVPFVRPLDLAGDNTPGIDPVLHAMANMPGYDYIILLQPTSPLRTSADIDACLELCLLQKARAIVSVTEPDKSPYWMCTVDENHKMTFLLNQEKLKTTRQELPRIVALNGAIYIAESNWLIQSRSFITEETIAFPMPKERSMDIDTEFDLLLAEAVMRMFK